MADAEKFDIFKFFGSFTQVLPWVKTIRYALGILGVGFIGLTIYRAYFMPTKREVTQIVAEAGSRVSLIRKEDKKGITVTPFIEGYGFAESDKRTGAGAKVGVRIDF
ncbi:MAG: hypothetical protein WC419_07315 [Candidatus Omnitrophota bacterium]|jgi:hypothetical protein|nr:hypothetical protein [Candidatus Omnitrophota bacterium]